MFTQGLSSGSTILSVYLGNSAGTFTLAPGSPRELGTRNLLAFSADLDGDRKDDLILASEVGNLLTFVRAVGGGQFSQLWDSPVVSMTYPSSVVVGEFNGDSYPDLAVTGWVGAPLSVLLGGAGLNFTHAPGSPVDMGLLYGPPYSTYNERFSGGAVFSNVLVGDISKDGRDDIILAGYVSDNSPIAVLIGNGSGEFVRSSAPPVLPTGHPTPMLALRDFNGDGRLDLLLWPSEYGWALDIKLGSCPRADLAVTVSDSPDPIRRGTELTYTITVTNAGPDSAKTVKLANPTPTNTTFVSLASPPGWTCQTPPPGGVGTITCTIPTLPPGQSTFTFKARVNSGTPVGSTLSNTATVESVSGGDTVGNNTATASTTVSSEPAPTCAPRPNVEIRPTRIDRNTLDVVVATGVNDSMQINQLTSIDVAGIVNARVTHGTDVDKTAPFTIAFPNNVQGTRLTLKRVQLDLPFRVDLVVTDNCGPWKTFVGAGTG